MDTGGDIVRLTRVIPLPTAADDAYARLLDLEQVAAAVPGTTLTSWDGTDFAATIRLRLGPLPVVGHGRGGFTRRDPESRRATLVVDRLDGARVATVLMAIRADPGVDAACEVAVRADVMAPALGGRVGRVLVREVADRMLDRSTEVFVAALSGTPTSVPLHEDGSYHLGLPAALTGVGDVASAVVRRVFRR